MNRALGDSITYGVGASSYSNSWIGKVQAALGQNITNKAVSATQLLDAVLVMYNDATTFSDGDKTFLLPGYNDMRHYGADANGIATFTSALMAALVWAAVPHSRKIWAQNSAWTETGVWSNVSPYGSWVAGKYSSQNGATKTITFKGSSVYIGYVSYPPAVGTLCRVLVDGITVGTIDGRIGLTSVLAPAYWPGCARFSGFNSGHHTLQLVVDTSTGGSQFFLDYIASNEKSSKAGEGIIYLGNTLEMTLTGYAIGNPSWDKGSDLIVAQYNSIIKSTADALSSDGFSVRRIDASLNYNPRTGEIISDDQHPNDTGHQNIANAFIERL